MARGKESEPKAKTSRSSGSKARSGKAPKPAEIVGAAQRADLARLRSLHARGADLNASWRNYRALHALLQERPHGPETDDAGERADPRRLACLDWLLAHGADPDALGAWPSARASLIAAFAGEPAYFERMLAAGARVDLHIEAARGDVAAVRRALARDRTLAATADEGGLTPLMACAASRLHARDGHGAQRACALATLLLDAGADPNARVRSWGQSVDAAYFAIGARQLELLELLLARGAQAESALVSAAWHADRRFAEAALRHGARPDHALAEGRPILNELVRWGQVDPALWLLARGASPNRADARGWTALHQAVSRGNARLIAALLAAGGDPRKPDAEGTTPFELAVAKGRPKLIALFRA